MSVQSELVDLVVDVELVLRIHVVVDSPSTCRGHAGVAIAEDAAVGIDLFGHVADAVDALDRLVAASQNAAHLVGRALLRMLDELILKLARKDEAVYHQTLLRTVSCASSMD